MGSQRKSAALALLFLLCGSLPAAGQGVATLTAEGGAADPGTTISLSVNLLSDVPASGFSYGLRLDAAVATPMNIQLSPFLASLNGGAGPSFVNLEPFTTMSGFAFGVVLDFFGGPDATIPGNVLHPITTYDAVIDPAAPSGMTAIELRGDLSDPGFAPVAILVSDEAGVDMITSGVAGMLEVTGVPSFLRGDVNESGAITLGDATVLLAQLFQGFAMACPAASDVDGSGAVLIDDAIGILLYLFDGGLAPAAPFPICGDPPSPPHLSCARSGCP